MTVSILLVSEKPSLVLTLVYEIFIGLCLVKTLVKLLREYACTSSPLCLIKKSFWWCSMALIICTFLFFFPGITYEPKWSRKTGFFYDGLEMLIQFLFLVTIFLCLFLTESTVQLLLEKNKTKVVSIKWSSFWKNMICPFFALFLNLPWILTSFINFNFITEPISFNQNNFEGAMDLKNSYIMNTALVKIIMAISLVPWALTSLIYFQFVFRVIPLLSLIFTVIKQYRFAKKDNKIKRYRFGEWIAFLFFILFIGVLKTVHSMLLVGYQNNFSYQRWVGFEEVMAPSVEDTVFRVINKDKKFYYLDIHSILSATAFGMMSFVLAFVAPSRKAKKYSLDT